MNTSNSFLRRFKFRDLKVSHKLLAMVLFMMGSAIAIALAYTSVLRVGSEAETLERQTVDLVQLIGQIEGGVLEARRQEKNFQLRNELRYRDTHSLIIKKVEKRLNELGELLGIEQDKEQIDKEVIDEAIARDKQTEFNKNDESFEESAADIIISMQQVLSDYGTFFNTLAESRIKFGLRSDLGLKGSLSAELNSIENKVLTSANANPALVVSVLRLRQAQAEYIMNPGDAALGIIGDEIQQLRELTEEQPMQSRAKNLLIDGIDNYQNKWPEVLGLVSGMQTAQLSFTNAVNQIDPMLAEIRDLSTEVRETNQLAIEDQRGASNRRFIVTLTAIGLILAIALILFALNLIRRLNEVVWIANLISKGDLSEEIKANDWGDELGQLSLTMDEMKGSLGNIISKTRHASTQVAVAASQVLSGNTELSSRTQEQASSLEEVAASMEEMTGTVDTNAENATRAAELAVTAKGLAGDGNDVAGKTAEAMDRIENSNARIIEILELIQDFAGQTNLLALNAAVEAARAGEHGRGFSVVASEVRRLAGRSADATKDAKILIDESVKNINEGAELVKHSTSMLSQIVESSSDVSDLVSEIAAASQEQSTGIQQVNRAVVEMDSITQQNAALVEEAAAASESMGVQAQQLKVLVEFFKLDEKANDSHTEATPLAPTSPAASQNDIRQVQESELADIEVVAARKNGTYDKKDDEWSQF